MLFSSPHKYVKEEAIAILIKRVPRVTTLETESIVPVIDLITVFA